MDPTTIYETVNIRYSSIADNAHLDSTDAGANTRIASSFGYSAEELASLPRGTNLGLSCGNPLATAHLKPSETLLDLGSGGGLDCLIAAHQMLKIDPSPTGKIYGVDRSAQMIALGRKNATATKIPPGLVEFIHAPIVKVPLEDATVDLIVSNCVINLVPDEDKPRVFREMYRLLIPGGRVAISDILAKKTLPDHIRRDAALLVGCVAGASLVAEYRRWFEDAGFRRESIVFVNTEKDLNVYNEGGCGDGSAACCGQEPNKANCSKKDEGKGVQGGDLGVDGHAEVEANEKMDFNEWVASYQIYAIK